MTYAHGSNQHKKRLTWKQRIGFAALLTLIGILSLAFYGEQWVGKELKAENIVPIVHAGETDEALALKSIHELESEMLEKIRKHESAGHSAGDGGLFLTFDPSSKMYDKCIKIGGKHPLDCLSVGEYQLKIGTVQLYHTQLYGSDISDVDALLLANDPAKARTFARDCIVKIEGCVWNWTSAQKDAAYFRIVIPIIRNATQ